MDFSGIKDKSKQNYSNTSQIKEVTSLMEEYSSPWYGNIIQNRAKISRNNSGQQTDMEDSNIEHLEES